MQFYILSILIILEDDDILTIINGGVYEHAI